MAAQAGATGAYRVLAADVIARVERTAEALYEDAMGSDWPVPYASLTVSEQEEWRGGAYCAAYALAVCPITRRVHPWLRSWCEPECRTPANSDYGASS
jgi:hypothetical protein